MEGVCMVRCNNAARKLSLQSHPIPNALYHHILTLSQALDHSEAVSQCKWPKLVETQLLLQYQLPALLLPRRLLVLSWLNPSTLCIKSDQVGRRFEKGNRG